MQASLVIAGKVVSFAYFLASESIEPEKDLTIKGS